MKFRNSLIASSLMHALPIVLLLAFSGSSFSKSKPKSANQSEKIEIVPKESKETVTEVELIKVKLPSKPRRPQVRHENQKCDTFFGGIGIEIGSGVSVDTGLTVIFVDKAFPGYPAYDGGIRSMDELLTPFDQVKGEVGTQVEITFKNATGVHVLTLVRDKICTQLKSHE